MAVPLALTLGPRRPLAMAACQAMMLSLFKPYPSVSDLALALALLPLFAGQQLALMRLGLLLAVSALLLGVLGPAMLHMWVGLESANSNFYYSTTLLYGVWQVLLLAQVLALTLRVDRVAGGKEVLAPGEVPGEEASEAEEAEEGADGGSGPGSPQQGEASGPAGGDSGGQGGSGGGGAPAKAVAPGAGASPAKRRNKGKGR